MNKLDTLRTFSWGGLSSVIHDASIALDNCWKREHSCQPASEIHDLELLTPPGVRRRPTRAFDSSRLSLDLAVRCATVLAIRRYSPRTTPPRPYLFYYYHGYKYA